MLEASVECSPELEVDCSWVVLHQVDCSPALEASVDYSWVVLDEVPCLELDCSPALEVVCSWAVLHEVPCLEVDFSRVGQVEEQACTPMLHVLQT